MVVTIGRVPCNRLWQNFNGGGMMPSVISEARHARIVGRLNKVCFDTALGRYLRQREATEAQPTLLMVTGTKTAFRVANRFRLVCVLVVVGHYMVVVWGCTCMVALAVNHQKHGWHRSRRWYLRCMDTILACRCHCQCLHYHLKLAGV